MKSLDVDDRITSPRAMLSRISHAKNQMKDAAAVRDSGWNFRDEELAKVYDGYTRALADSNALDFDDLLLTAVRLFEESDSARTRYAEQFRYVMVDEYQDTNRPQYLLVRHLAAHRNLCVVGDPDQSIYKWRGADVANILDFEEDFADATVVRLEQNYRSTQVILDAASGVISRNTGRQDKRLWTEREGGEAVISHRAHDELEEADFIVTQLRRAVARGDERAAVLYRTNAQSRAIEDALTREGIPYRIVGNVRFYERKEVKDALSYLRLMLNPDDDVSLRRVINVPARGIGKGVLESLEQLQPPDPGRVAVVCRCDPRRGRTRGVAVGTAGPCRRRTAGANARADRASWVPRPHHDADCGGQEGGWVSGPRQGPGPVGVYQGAAGHRNRGSREPRREPPGARIRRPRLRTSRGRCHAYGVRRPALPLVRHRRGTGFTRCAGVAHDAPRGQGT